MLHEPASEFEVEGVSNMPAYLQRFLGERAAQSGFSYDVVQDVERGWVARWKEYTTHGDRRRIRPALRETVRLARGLGLEP